MNVLQQLNEFMELKGWTQAQVARSSGVSGGAVSQYRSGTYPGNIGTVELKLTQMIQREREKEKTRRLTPDFLLTEVAKDGLEVIQIAHLDGELNVIYGDAGLGKTMMVRQYAKMHASAILIEADPGYTARVILDELASKLGLDIKGNMHDISDAIVKNITNTGRVILVDEAENLPYRALEVLRRIHDKSGIGIVLVGMPRLITNLKGKRGEYKQLYSRAGYKLEIGDSLPEGDIHQIACHILPELEGRPELLNALYTESKGNARRLFKYLRGISRSSDIEKKPITVKTIKAFTKMIIN